MPVSRTGNVSIHFVADIYCDEVNDSFLEGSDADEVFVGINRDTFNLGEQYEKLPAGSPGYWKMVENQSDSRHHVHVDFGTITVSSARKKLVEIDFLDHDDYSADDVLGTAWIECDASNGGITTTVTAWYAEHVIPLKTTPPEPHSREIRFRGKGNDCNYKVDLHILPH